MFKPRVKKIKYCSPICRYGAIRAPKVSMEVVERMSIPEPNTGCWLWLGATDGQEGYPRLAGARVHREVLSIKLGRRLSDGEVARHRCDNPGCVNPEHLEPGSAADNSTDCVLRGRRAHGIEVYNAKLSPEYVKVIYFLTAKGMLQKDIAESLGVSAAAVSHVLNGRSWIRESAEVQASQADEAA